MSLTAGDDADWCWKLTRSNASVRRSASGVGFAGFASFGICRIFS